MKQYTGQLLLLIRVMLVHGLRGCFVLNHFCREINIARIKRTNHFVYCSLLQRKYDTKLIQRMPVRSAFQLERYNTSRTSYLQETIYIYCLLYLRVELDRIMHYLTKCHYCSLLIELCKGKTYYKLYYYLCFQRFQHS